MPNVVPISKISDVTKGSIARVVNGLVALKKLGLTVKMPKEIQITMNVAPDDGINAVPRTSLASDGEQTATEVTDARTNSSTAAENGTTSDTGTSNETGTQNQSQAYGRQTLTEITYEI